MSERQWPSERYEIEGRCGSTSGTYVELPHHLDLIGGRQFWPEVTQDVMRLGVQLRTLAEGLEPAP